MNLPEWTSSDIGRIVYVISEDKVYVATATKWSQISFVELG
jgi:hypothetical protein